MRSLAARPWDDEGLNRAAWLILAAAGAVATVLILWLNRRGTFYFDELIWFSDLGGSNGPTSILEPHNSHLHGTIRSLYLLTMETVGTHYVVFRILGVLSVLLSAALFFALAKRRIGPVAALVPAILLLFLGSAWQHIVVPIGFTIVFSVAAGLAAFLALERNDRRGDVIACAAVSLSVFTFTVGLGFLVGVAISVLLRSDRFRRAWIFAIPLGLYAVWWIWAQQFDQGRTEASNIDAIVPFFGKSLNVVTGALTGVNVPFSRFGDAVAVNQAAPSALGWVVAAAFVVAVVWRISRGNVPRLLWAGLGVVGTYWLAAALASPVLLGTQADAVRYVYPGSIGILLVAVGAATGVRLGRRGLTALIAVGVFSLAMNIVFLRDGADYYANDYSPKTRATLAMYELGSGLEPGGDGGPSPALREVNPPGFGVVDFSSRADLYLDAVGRYGSPAFSLDELRSEPVEVRREADVWLIATYGLTIEPGGPPPDRDACTETRSPDSTEVPPGGATLRLAGSEPALLNLSRFGVDPGTGVGTLPPGRWSTLLIPADAAPEPWRVTPEGTAPLTVCPA